MIFRKEISLTASHMGQASPKFYGFAWHDHYRQCIVYYPMPFNLIMRWWVMLYKKIKFPHSVVFDEFVHGIYKEGFKDGYDNGWNDHTGTFTNPRSSIVLTYAPEQENKL